MVEEAAVNCATSDNEGELKRATELAGSKNSLYIHLKLKKTFVFLKR